MSFVIKFMGATVQSITSQLGWNGQPGSLDVRVIEDDAANDSFSPVSNGQPVYFSLGSFQFNGIQQKWDRLDDIQNHPAYQIICSGPESILENCKLIIGGYTGYTNYVSNVINCYGYWEDQLGYGGSLATDAGMPWHLIRSAVQTQTASTGSVFGGPIKLRGFNYSVDLSQIPNLPSYFRIGGSSIISLTDYINTCCQAANCDWFARMSGTTITIIVANRNNQPPLGTLSAFADSYTGTTKIRMRNGLEFRNEPTSMLLLGGQKTTLFKATVFDRFYGIDFDGTPITAVPETIYLTKDDPNFVGPPAPGQGIPQVDCGQIDTYSMRLYCPELSDILGDVYYLTTELELQCLVGSNFTGKDPGMWEWYIKKFRPDVAALIYTPMGLNVPPVINGAAGNVLPPDWVNPKAADVANVANQAETLDKISLERRLKDFLTNIAQKYFGKAYLIYLPSVLKKIDPDSLKLVTSSELIDGGYSDDGDLSGLPNYLWPEFSLQDGRFTAFAYMNLPRKYYVNTAFGWENMALADIQELIAEEAITAADVMNIVDFEPEANSNGRQLLPPNNNKYFTKLRVNNKIYTNVDATVAVFLESPVMYRHGDGLSNTLSRLMNADRLHNLPQNVPAGNIIPVANLQQNLAMGSVSRPILHPGYVIPECFYIPLKSNILTYGPWYVAGADGNTTVEQDSSMVPWNFAGYQYMNLAANARIQSSYSNMQDIESGELELAGLPAFSLGDILQGNGPNITNVRVSLSTQAVTTTYSFATYIPRFGQIGKYNSDILRKLGNTINTKQREYLNNLRNAIGVNQALIDAQFNRNGGIFRNVPGAVIGQSPHSVLFSKTILDDDGYLKTGVSTAERLEALLHIGKGNEYQKGAIADLSCVFRHYSLFGSGIYMPQMLEPEGVWSGSGIINSTSYNPLFSAYGNDILQYTFNDDFPVSGLASFEKDKIHLQRTPSKLFGLKGPLIINGFGFDIHGQITPNIPQFARRPDLWKVGPVDLLWKDYSKVWTCHSTIKGVTNENIEPNTSGIMTIYRSSGLATSETIYVYNWWSSTVNSSTKIQATYIPESNYWEISAADCT